MSLALSVTQPAPTCSEHDLVAAVRHGDDRAFEELYSRYRPPDRVLHVRHGGRSRPRRGHRPGGLHLGAAPDARRPTRRSPSSRGSTRSPRTPASTSSAVRGARARSRSTPTTSSSDDGGAGARSAATRPPTARSRPSSRSTTCGAPLTACRRPITRSSSCASSTASPTPRSASGWACPGDGREHPVPRPAPAERGVRRAGQRTALPAASRRSSGSTTRRCCASSESGSAARWRATSPTASPAVARRGWPGSTSRSSRPRP